MQKGIVRKLLFCYFLKGNYSCRVPFGLQAELNNEINQSRNVLPREFNRKLCDLSELKHFKASEFRTWLLYIGPLLLKSVLKKEFYQNILLLHFGIYYFANPNCKHLHEQAKWCISQFVIQCRHLFGPQFCAYNVHVLCHLHEFVDMYGPLDAFSAFPFENYLQILKQQIKGNSYIFKQTCHNLILIRSLYSNFRDDKLFYASTLPNNCCVIFDNQILQIDSVGSDNTVCGYIMRRKCGFYNYPYSSEVVNIGRFCKTNNYVRNVVPVNKCIIVPQCENEFTILPFANPYFYQ